MDFTTSLSLSQCYPCLLPIILLLISPLLLFMALPNNRSQPAGEALRLPPPPPSPPRLPVVGNLHQLGRLPHRSLRALSKKYGPIMLLHLGQSPTIVVSSPDLVEEIVNNHDIVFSDRPKATATDVLFYEGKDIGFSSYGDYWRQARRVCTRQLLSLERVQSFHPVREEEVLLLVDRLRRASVKGESVNLSKILISTSNNITLRCILGQKFNTMEDGVSTLEKLGRKMMEQVMAFSVGDFFPSLRWIDVIRGFIASLNSTFRELEAFYKQVIEEHRKGNRVTTNHDFVDILVQLQNDGKLDFVFTDDHVKAILQDMLLGGVVTISSVLEWLMAELLRNPRVMKKVQEEVRRVVGQKEKVDMDDVNRMDYLKCTFRETIRLHPTGPLLIPRETSRSVEIRGYHIPAKTKVIVNCWAIQRHPDFWDRPEEFIPERFENNPFYDFNSHGQFQLIPFGFGRRQCPGMQLGITTIEYLIANLLYWFDWKLPTGDHLDQALPQDLDMSEVFGISVHKKVPLHVVPIHCHP